MPAQWVNLVAGCVALALGAGVLALRRTPAALALAGLGVASGSVYVISSLVGLGRPSALTLPTPLLWGAVFAWAASAFGILALFPRPIGRRDAPLLAASLAVATAGAVLSGIARPEGSFDYAGATARDRSLLMIGLIATNAAAGAATVAYPIRVRGLPAIDTGTARSYAIVAVGFTLMSAGTIARSSFTELMGSPLEIPYHLANFTYVLGPILLWILATRSPHARLARNTALAMCAIFLVSVLLPADVTPFAYPVGRVLAFLFLTYAVLRGQIEGLDIKVRFALSKSTIAAVFIAVFFVASEVAQQFFGETLGSTYVGIAAAGMLVFAMAPLQRAAERLAEKAVPLSAPSAMASGGSPSSGALDRERAYRTAVRGYLRDGMLSRDEERELAHLAGELGIHAGRAMEMRHEVEDERTKRS